jgi:hypothetical protein
MLINAKRIGWEAWAVEGGGRRWGPDRPPTHTARRILGLYKTAAIHWCMHIRATLTGAERRTWFSGPSYISAEAR